MKLPKHYLITPSIKNEVQFLASLEKSLATGISLMQLRGKGMNLGTYQKLAEKVIEIANRYHCKVLLTDASLVTKLGAAGLHLDSKQLATREIRPISSEYLLATSGHTLKALQKAERFQADFAVLSPVKFTKAHPDLEPLGWDGFSHMVGQVNIPGYALGGVSLEDTEVAIKAGGQGVAGNKGLWL